jgi:hypothetical protein
LLGVLALTKSKLKRRVFDAKVLKVAQLYALELPLRLDRRARPRHAMKDSTLI